MATARLGLTALDCSDPSVLADFWAALLGGDVSHRNDEFCAVKVDGGLLVAVKVQDYKAPTWPEMNHTPLRSGMAADTFAVMATRAAADKVSNRLDISTFSVLCARSTL